MDGLGSALAAARMGLRVLPLVEKLAVWMDWPARATADQKVVERAVRGNYGILCDRLAIIDTDTRELSEWWYRNMPETPWMVKTPHGGLHFYYESVPGLRNAVKAHRGWDVRAGGRSYIVGAGSVVDGRPYELVGEATLDLPPFDPDWLPRAPMNIAPTRARVVTPTGRIHNLRAYIRRIVSIQGQRGSDACFRVACVLRDEGLTPDEALSYMLEWNETSAIPPWTVKELEKKVRDAYAKLMKGG